MADGLRQRRRGKGIYRRNVLDLAGKGKVVEIGFLRDLHSRNSPNLRAYGS